MMDGKKRNRVQKSTPSPKKQKPVKKVTTRSSSNSMPKPPVRNNLRRNRKRRQQRKYRGGCLAFLLGIVLIVAILFGIGSGLKKWAGSWWDIFLSKTLSQEVLDYADIMSSTASDEGIPEFKDVLLCIMMQESKGQSNDPMQSSECHYNTEYPQQPNGIQDPVYSIQCGAAYFRDCLALAGCKTPEDYRALTLALQGYNFGTGYISWALDRDGGWTEENAQAFSDLMKAELNVPVYGDPQYAGRVLAYYEFLIEEQKE